MDRGQVLTFAWHQEEDRVIGDPRLHDNRFFEERLHEAVEWELSLRGIRYNESSPDLLLHHHFSLADHELVREVVDDSGYATAEVLSYEEGTVVVHLHYAQTEGAFWVGWAQADVTPALHSPEDMRTWVYRLVGRMFKGWPVPRRTGR